MTISILMRIYSNINRDDPFDASIWALFLLCFHLLLRKSNVTPDSMHETKFLRHEHLVRTESGYLVTLFWTKTLQQGEYALKFPIFKAVSSPLCAVTALDRMIALVPASPDDPAFCFLGGLPIKYATFNSQLKKHISALSMSTKNWSSHSFRRGGASYLASTGAPERQIQMLGDWKSDCYKCYIHCPWNDKLEIAARTKAFLLKFTCR